MTMVPGNPNTGPMRDLPPGPHAGVDTDPNAVPAPGSIDSRARNALTLGVLSLVLGVLTGIPAIWYGQRALRRIDTSDGELEGRGAAWAGIALGCLGVVGTFGLWLYLHQN